MKKIGKILLTVLIAFTTMTANIQKPEADSGITLNGTNPLIWLLDPAPFRFNNPDEAMIYMTVDTQFGRLQAFCIEPDVKSHLGDTYSFSPGEIADQEAAKIIWTYYNSSNPLRGSRAGYQAAQIAIWAKIRS